MYVMFAATYTMRPTEIPKTALHPEPSGKISRQTGYALSAALARISSLHRHKLRK